MKHRRLKSWVKRTLEVIAVIVIVILICGGNETTYDTPYGQVKCHGAVCSGSKPAMEFLGA